MATSYSPKIVTDGLVLYLDAANPRSYVSGSAQWNDISENLNSGSLTNGPTFNSANGGNIVFDGTNDFVNVLYPTALNNTPSFTVECVVKADATVTILDTIFQRIISYTSASKNIQFGLARTSGSAVGSERMFYIINSATQSNPNYSVANIPTGSIYHVVSTFDGISTYQMYLNGIAAPNAPFVPNFPDALIGVFVSAGTFVIGQRGNGAYLSGSIYNVKVYNKALSAQEILQNYNATRSRFGI
jgi:hypothetical protein